MKTECQQVVDLNQWVVLGLMEGRLDDRRQGQLERDVLRGGERFELLEMAEAILLDRHFRGELSQQEENALTRALAQGGRRLQERAGFSRALATRMRESPLAS